jgi:hypothetical protein
MICIISPIQIPRTARIVAILPGSNSRGVRVRVRSARKTAALRAERGCPGSILYVTPGKGQRGIRLHRRSGATIMTIQPFPGQGRTVTRYHRFT